MERRKDLLIGLLAAAVTFGSLYAFAGDKVFSRNRHFQKNCHRKNSNHNDWYKDGERPSVNSSDSTHIY